MSELERVGGRVWDVIICGGGLAGLTLALQLRQQQPERSVLVLERTTRPLADAAHKVGESSVELGSQYFESLGLKPYLLERQLIKHGLRFFPGGGELPVEQRTEIGPAQEPIVNSYQLDRGRFETDLRAMIEHAGATLVEGVSAREPVLGEGGATHTVTVRGRDGAEAQAEGRWLIDATGRNALLRKQQKQTRRTGHGACSGWYRVEGKVDINDLVPKDHARWFELELWDQRWRSTNHFMGPGYWVWVIPLSTGNTSIGAVIHTDTHSFDDVRSLERVQEFIAKHEPVLAKHLEEFKVIDFLCLNDYSHTLSRPWSADRWGMVGEAGAFVDPLYSPGSDFIAFANSFTGELIRADFAGDDLETRVRELSLQYRALVAGSTDVYRIAAPLYGHPRGMLAKLYWDNLAYWSFPCQYFLQGIWRLSGAEHAKFSDVGQRFVQLSNYMQALLREFGLETPAVQDGKFWGMPKFPSILVDTHLALRDRTSPDETLQRMEARAAQAEEVAGEILLRVLWEAGPESARRIVDAARVREWQLTVDAGRVEADSTVGLARRRALSPMARDVERSLGEHPRNTPNSLILELIAPLLVTAPPPAEASAS